MKKTEKSPNMPVDEIDLQILTLLSENARMPARHIAERMHLSPTAIASRIEKLETEGYIEGYGVRLSPKKFGFTVKAFINLQVEPLQKKEFYAYVRSFPQVVECNCVTGDYSMLLEVVFRSTDDLDHFIGELQHFGKTQTQIVFSTAVEHRERFIDL